MPVLLVGLTGGIGTGKSSVSGILQNEKYNYGLVDADQIARSVVQPGKKAYRRIREEFGDEVFDDQNGGLLDREKLGLIIFSDREKRRKLDAITHPEIIKATIWEILCNVMKLNTIIFLDTPLLYETKMDKFVQRVVVVACNEEAQIERIVHRDAISREEAKKRIQAQMPLEIKVQRADFVITNDEDLQRLEAAVEEMLHYVQSEYTAFTLRFLFWASILFILPFGLFLAHLWNSE